MGTSHLPLPPNDDREPLPERRHSESFRSVPEPVDTAGGEAARTTGLYATKPAWYRRLIASLGDLLARGFDRADAAASALLAAGGRRRWLVIVPAAVALVAVVVGIGVAASIHRPEVDGLGEYVPRLTTRLAAADGSMLRTYSRENRLLIRPGEVPPVLEQAILSIEDSRFYLHGGVDLYGIARSLVKNAIRGYRSQGASTLTMQLARGVFTLTREKAWWRKIEEAFLAVEIEKNYSKEQILTLYANLVNLGHGNYGMEAASRAYFGKPVDALELVEAATLAGIAQRPAAYSPWYQPERTQRRRNQVLARMHAEGHIDAETLAEAVEKPLLVVPRRPRGDGEHGSEGAHFAEEIRRYLAKQYGSNTLYDRGLVVETTVEPAIQRAAEEALREGLIELDHRLGWRGASARLDADVADNPETVELPSWNDDASHGDALVPATGSHTGTGTAASPARLERWFEGVVLESGRQQARIRHGDHEHTLGIDGLRWTGNRRPSDVLQRGDIAWFRFEDGDGGEDPKLILEQKPELQGAILVLESETGAVRAMVGGFDYADSELNRSTQSKRQVGSAFKLFVYGAALENGFTAGDTLFDGPTAFPGAGNRLTYSPRNNSRRYYGVTTLRRALESSLNVTAVKLMDMVGVEHTVEFARRCGIASDLPPYPSLALGAADLRPMELASAYAAVANGGIWNRPYLIESVSDAAGRPLESHRAQPRRAMSPQIAHLLRHLLRGVTTRGSAARRLAEVPIATAGKTGTTNGYTDAWFVGFTPRYTILTWVGHDLKRPIGRGMTGSAAALPIWKKVVAKGLGEGWLKEGESFTPPPPGIVAVDIDPRTGHLPRARSKEKVVTLEEHFLTGTEPLRRAPIELARALDLPWYLQEPYYLPKENERMPSQVENWEPIRQRWQGPSARGAGSP